MVAMRSVPQSRAVLDVFSIDDAMRSNYDALRAEVVPQLSPVIVIQPDLSGGTYTLVVDGAHSTVHPASPVFQLTKSVCHAPLGLFSILAPYLEGPRTDGWVAPLQAYRDVLAVGREAVADCGLPDAGVAASTEILTGAVDFADAVLSEGTFSIDEFQAFTSAVHVAIETNMRLAAEDLVVGVQRQLTTWKQMLGAEAWKELYVVILALWTTAIRNQHWVILRDAMDAEAVDDHLITIPVGDPDEITIPVALDNLARIVQDKLAAIMVFSAPSQQALQVGLADPTDLLADAVGLAIKSCPRGAVHDRLGGELAQTAT
jgi:hypothetical protein